jgi:hypothetical protein
VAGLAAQSTCQSIILWRIFIIYRNNRGLESIKSGDCLGSQCESQTETETNGGDPQSGIFPV